MNNLNKIAQIVKISIVAMVVSGCDKEIDFVTPILQPNATYEIEVWGGNPEFIEFTPKGNTDYFCVAPVVTGDATKTMFCMPKKLEN